MFWHKLPLLLPLLVYKNRRKACHRSVFRYNAPPLFLYDLSQFRLILDIFLSQFASLGLRLSANGNCSFCAEEIQDEAVKCKHCGEWLNKKSLADYINVTRNFIEKKLEDYQEYKEKHLYYPEANKPIELKDTQFYPEHFIYKNKKFNYSQIYGITERNYFQSINGIPTEKKFTCILFVKSEFLKKGIMK